jgi:murein DD-endopeptidase MepM/ murein hydrolase activator NlpD
VDPQRPQPGALVQLTLRLEANRAAAQRIEGTLAGESLHFRQVESGVWRAIGPVPADGSTSLSARAVLHSAAGVAETLSVTITPAPLPRAAAQPLAVDTQFTRPMDSATQARIARENERAREVGRRAHATPPLWTTPFARPRNSVITSDFGAGRVFNGRVTSQHLGVDFRGAVGEPVTAANRGVVALVDTFFLAGTVVYIDHGGGLVTGYFHLSRALVARGDTVARGERVGLVGATGRVTGPHLHWNARYGGVTINPLELMALDPALYGSARRP